LATVPRSREARKTSRTFTVFAINGKPVLSITQDGVVRAYLVRPIPHAFGRAAFTLAKADNGDGHAEEYNVLLNGDRSTCDCADATYRSRACKHILACQAALDAGKLQAAPKPAPVIVNAEESAMANALLGQERHRQAMAAPPQICVGCDQPVRECDCTI
jgi:hypothetical protein